METIYTMIARFYTGMYERDESEDRGAGLVEYALLVVLIAIAAATAIGLAGDEISATFDDIVTELGG